MGGRSDKDFQTECSRTMSMSSSSMLKSKHSQQRGPEVIQLMRFPDLNNEGAEQHVFGLGVAWRGVDIVHSDVKHSFRLYL